MFCLLTEFRGLNRVDEGGFVNGKKMFNWIVLSLGIVCSVVSRDFGIIFDLFYIWEYWLFVVNDCVMLYWMGMFVKPCNIFNTWFCEVSK